MTLIQEIQKKWKPRNTRSHKGDYGRVFILAGSRGLTGAAYLSAMAAVRAGAGLVTLGVPEAVYPVVARRAAEVMVRPFPSNRQGSLAFSARRAILNFAAAQDVLAVGPGLSQNPDTQKLIRSLLQTGLPTILDADGLNAFRAQTAGLLKHAQPLILTPHPGEFKKVFQSKLPSTDHGRKQSAVAAAKKCRVIMILKGHHTVVADPRGRVFVNPTGNPGMATGGTGDVLTGILAALLGQGFEPWDAARFGVYLHGLAGDLAARRYGEVSLAAGDLLEFLPAAIRKARGR